MLPELPDQPVPSTKKFPVTVAIIIGIIAVLAAIPSVYFYSQYRKSQEFIKNPQIAANMEKKNLLDKLAKFLDLPPGEDPTVATVTDQTKLRAQPFFAKVENGDKIIIYPIAKKAIIYRPSIDKVIEVVPVNVSQAISTPVPASAGASNAPKTSPNLIDEQLAVAASPTPAIPAKTSIPKPTATPVIPVSSPLP